MNKLDKNSIIGISALLVHAANIDEIYSGHEKDLIKNFIKSYLKDEDTNEILKKAEDIENNSNQLLKYAYCITGCSQMLINKCHNIFPSIKKAKFLPLYNGVSDIFLNKKIIDFKEDYIFCVDRH